MLINNYYLDGMVFLNRQLRMIINDMEKKSRFDYSV